MSNTGIRVNITPAAIQELKRVATEEKNTLKVRIGFRAGGCSGFSINMDFTETDPDEFDMTFEQDGIEFMVDKKSALYVHGATLDYGGDGLLNIGFQWSFPSSTSSCGCGTSFSF